MVEWFAENKPIVSAVTLVERFTHPYEVFQKAIELRQQRNVSVSDMLIAATAIFHNSSFAALNWIDDLQVIDPLGKR